MEMLSSRPWPKPRRNQQRRIQRRCSKMGKFSPARDTTSLAPALDNSSTRSATRVEKGANSVPFVREAPQRTCFIRFEHSIAQLHPFLDEARIVVRDDSRTWVRIHDQSQSSGLRSKRMYAQIRSIFQE